MPLNPGSVFCTPNYQLLIPFLCYTKSQLLGKQGYRGSILGGGGEEKWVFARLCANQESQARLLPQ